MKDKKKGEKKFVDIIVLYYEFSLLVIAFSIWLHIRGTLRNGPSDIVVT